MTCRLSIVALAAVLCGCGHFTLVQGDTRISAWTFLDSKSQLSRLAMTDTNRSRISIGNLNQETSGSNAVSIVEAAVSAAVRAAVKP